MRRILTLITICLLFCNPCIAEVYHFNSIKNLVEQEIGIIILPKVYQKLDIDIYIHPLPGKRAQIEVIQGRADGEIMRIWTYGLETPTVIRVPTPYYHLETMAFVRKDSNITINSRDDLQKYTIAKVSGVKHTDNITNGLEDVYELANTEQMMDFLLAGRADVALTNSLDGLVEIQRLGLTNIIQAGEPLDTLDLYHYIHKDHHELVSRVDTVIKEMIGNGEMQALIDKAGIEIAQRRLGNEQPGEQP